MGMSTSSPRRYESRRAHLASAIRALLALLHLLLVLGSVAQLGFAVQVTADPPDGKEAEL
jgi:hypothetical protein